jgi:protein-tyrosine phosphatase
MGHFQHMNGHSSMHRCNPLANGTSNSLSNAQFLGLKDYKKLVTSTGLQYTSMPIVDMCIPDDAQAAHELIQDVAAAVQSGTRVLVHCKFGSTTLCSEAHSTAPKIELCCREGVGRAGMVCACVLLQMGAVDSAAAAIRHIRLHRHKQAVQTTRQEMFVKLFAEKISQPSTQSSSHDSVSLMEAAS